MKLKIFCILAADFTLSVMGLALLFYFCMKNPTMLRCVHYAVDTMTLRGRLPEPPDRDLVHPFIFKAAEDVASLSVFILLGFGLGFYLRAIESVRLRSEFRGSAEARAWPEWLQEHHAEAHQKYYGTANTEDNLWKRFRRWLHEM